MWQFCVSSKFMYWNQINNEMVLVGGEQSSDMELVPYKRNPRELSSLFHHEDTAGWQFINPKEVSPDTDPTGALILRFSAAKAERGKFLLFISHLSAVICYSSQKRLIHTESDPILTWKKEVRLLCFPNVHRYNQEKRGSYDTTYWKITRAK